MRSTRRSAMKPGPAGPVAARPGNRDGSARRFRRLAAAVLLTGLVAVAAGCSGGSNEASSGDTQTVGDGQEGGAAGDFAGSDSDGGKAALEAPNGANRTTVQDRSVIRTGQVALTGKNLDETRDEVDQLLFAMGGSIDSEQTTHDDEGGIERSTLVLRVPVAKFEATMKALEKLGKVKTSESTSKDVTTEVIDVNERVETLQTSLDRLQRFQSQSENIDDLIRFEDQITTRESELRSLEAQQAHLLDQTAMSTITLYLSVPDKYVPPPGALDDAGFLAGLKGGWNALKDFVVVGLTVAGAALPFAIAFALVGVPTWLLVRLSAGRRAGAGGGPDTDGTGSTGSTGTTGSMEAATEA